MKIVYIRWCDAIQNVDKAWTDVELVKQWAEYSDWEVESVGWLVTETKEYVVLASKCEKDQDDQIQIGMIIKIPKTWIRERRELK